MREAYQPSETKLQEFELGQAGKAQDYAATAPYQEAALTGSLLGKQTLGGRAQSLGEELGRGSAALAEKQYETGKEQWGQGFEEGQRRFNTQTGQWEKGFERGGEQFERQAKENQLNRLIQLAQDPTNTQAAAEANRLMQELYGGGAGEVYGGPAPFTQPSGVAPPPTGRPVTAPAAPGQGIQIQPAPQQGIVQPGTVGPVGPVGGVVGAQKDPAETKAKNLGFDDAYSMNLFMESHPEDAAAIENPAFKEISIYDRGRAQEMVGRLKDIAGDSGARYETLNIMRQLRSMGYKASDVGRYAGQWEEQLGG